MSWRKLALLSLCLILLTTAAWADQNLLVKGMEAQKTGKNEQAVTLLSQYLQQYPQIPEARRYLALALGQNDRALSYFEGAVAADPLDPDKYNLLGQALILKGRSDEAQHCYGIDSRAGRVHADGAGEALAPIRTDDQWPHRERRGAYNRQQLDHTGGC